MSAAEDATDKAAISPGPLAPARELYGEMLLDAGKAKEALVDDEEGVESLPRPVWRRAGGRRRGRQSEGHDLLRSCSTWRVKATRIDLSFSRRGNSLGKAGRRVGLVRQIWSGPTILRVW